MKIGKLIRRFLIPGFVNQVRCLVRFRALVSQRAEVEVTPTMDLGRGTVISSFTKVKSAGPMRTGRRVHIASNCFLEAGEGGLTLGNDVMIGPGTCIITTNYLYSKIGVPVFEQGTTSRGVRVGDRTWIGAGCTILDGSTLGEDVIVTPGSVVTGDVADRVIVQGNPAQPIFTRR